MTIPMGVRRPASWLLTAACAMCLSIGVEAQQGELIERTLAIVAGQAITLADVRAAVSLGLVAGADGKDAMAVATTRLVDRALIVREVQRYAPPDPGDAMVEAGIDGVRRRFPQPGALARTLEETGFTETRLRFWIRDDLRIQAYLGQRFGAASAPTGPELTAAYQQAREEFERTGTSFEQALPILRDRLAASRRLELIADWVSDLRRRTEVVLLPE